MVNQVLSDQNWLPATSWTRSESPTTVLPIRHEFQFVCVRFWCFLGRAERKFTRTEYKKLWTCLKHCPSFGKIKKLYRHFCNTVYKWKTCKGCTVLYTQQNIVSVCPEFPLVSTMALSSFLWPMSKLMVSFLFNVPLHQLCGKSAEQFFIMSPERAHCWRNKSRCLT